MQSDITFIRNRALAFIACAVFLCAMMGLVFIDVRYVNNAIHENSLTEMAQELMLLVIALLFFWHAYRHRGLRPSLTLVGGFFSCMLIRELDFLFDEISHGSWVWFALAVTAPCVAIAALQPARTFAGLADFLRHPDWGMMAAGLLVVLVFSRLFGMHEFWRYLMQGDYNHAVKNMAEEVCELLGYSLCLLATWRYLYGAESVTASSRLVD
ncbi:hypothetical protein AAH446_12425 [Erwinia sp. P6884]|uniref:hypothetical protein n=1 Tax=Erwinia sp. P6884 TaxID=3141450 RepID=UPI003186EF64